MLPLLQPIQWIVVHIRVSENCSSCTSFARDQMNSTTYSEKNVENVSYQSSMRAVTVFIFFTSICSVVGMWQEQILLNAPLKWPFCHDGILLRSRHISKAFFFFKWVSLFGPLNLMIQIAQILSYFFSSTCFPKCIPQ